jgi:hypothetical protein
MPTLQSQRVASFTASIFGEMRLLAQRHNIARFCIAKQHATLEAVGERLLRVGQLRWVIASNN